MLTQQSMSSAPALDGENTQPSHSNSKAETAKFQGLSEAQRNRMASLMPSDPMTFQNSAASDQCPREELAGERPTQSVIKLRGLLSDMRESEEGKNDANEINLMYQPRVEMAPANDANSSQAAANMSPSTDAAGPGFD